MGQFPWAAETWNPSDSPHPHKANFLQHLSHIFCVETDLLSDHKEQIQTPSALRWFCNSSYCVSVKYIFAHISSSYQQSLLFYSYDSFAKDSSALTSNIFHTGTFYAVPRLSGLAQNELQVGVIVIVFTESSVPSMVRDGYSSKSSHVMRHHLI